MDPKGCAPDPASTVGTETVLLENSRSVEMGSNVFSGDLEVPDVDDSFEEGYASSGRESENFDAASTEISAEFLLQHSEEHLPMTENDRHCWVCFASEEDDPVAVWTHPCRCRGTTKWVHQACIQRWIDEKQKGGLNAATTQVTCPQCGTVYKISFPLGNPFVLLLDSSDTMIHRLCPLIAGGVCVGALYWTCVTFGAVTFMQVVGHDRGLILMERTDPLFLLVSLPLVPVTLVLGKMLRWEEPVLRHLRIFVPKIPIVRNLLPAFATAPERRALQSSLPPLSDPVSVTRTFCGALLLPTIAACLGSALFSNAPSQMRRTMMGGITFLVVKGVLKVYHKQQIYLRQCQRKILDYEEDET